MSAWLVQACMSTRPDTPESRNQQASLEVARQMVAQGEYQRAVQFLLPRSRKEDAPSEVHVLLGLSFLGLNKAESAFKSFAFVVKNDPSHDDARLNLAYTQILLGRHADARRDLNEILKRGKYLYPEKVRLNIGLSFLQEKKCEKAIPEFNAALELDPTYSAPYFNIAKCHTLSGRWTEARANFQRAVDFCPDCSEPQIELAAVAHRLGDKKKAIMHLENVVRANPDAANDKRVIALRKQMTR